ncbi:NADH:ubiquinone reductase (Na(+)-transporting) subunit F [Enemella sp. A6]|uniref:NADH:ubiquinone reductase (Na(+)-transporting) subunit F n=1 Tax=Enemella sp. A6 TaxID=3440152 RepID=UPI003EB897E1
MGEKYTITFEPVDLEMEVDEDETILDAAFRQGVNLMHGCREGRCSACKSFVLDGDIQLDYYSTFALNDFELDEGYTLLCKAHAYSDCQIELLNYDEDEIHNAVPIQEITTKIAAITHVTSDIVSLKLDVVAPQKGFTFKAGQYADIHLPDCADTRSFSMASTQADPTALEFLIKQYPGGKMAEMLDNELKAGDELKLTGPYGSCTVKPGEERPVVCIGGGAGMAPLLSIVRHMAENGIDREVRFFYGARTPDDLFYLDEIKALGEKFSDFAFTVVLSHTDDPDWSSLGLSDGEVGMVTDAVERSQLILPERDVYLCGPPPMVDAALELMEREGVPIQQTHYDKFESAVAATV